MAIGDNNATGNKIFESTYYSRLVLKNGDGKRLNIRYNSGLMVLEIGKTIGSGDTFKVEVEEAIYLSPTKAYLLANQIEAMLAYRKTDDTDPARAFGVNAGMGEKVTYIAFSVDKDKAITITIGKFDGNGVVVESANFRMSLDYNYALDWDNLASNSLTKVYDNDIEITMLKNAIIDFGRSMSGAAAYAVIDTARYDQNRINRRIDQVFDKLGIERTNYSNKSFNSTNNYLNNTPSKSTSYEEIEDLLL